MGNRPTADLFYGVNLKGWNTDWLNDEDPVAAFETAAAEAFNVTEEEVRSVTGIMLLNYGSYDAGDVDYGLCVVESWFHSDWEYTPHIVIPGDVPTLWEWDSAIFTLCDRMKLKLPVASEIGWHLAASYG